MLLPGSGLARRLLVVTAWVVGTALAGTVAWAAVSRLGSGSAGTASRPLSPAEVRSQLDHARPRQTPTSSPGGPVHRANRSRDTHRRASLATPYTSRSWQVRGGAVGVGCHGTTATMLYATPHDGWAYRLDDHEATTVSVEFSRAQQRSGLTARCANGTPVRASGSDAENGSEAPAGPRD